MAADRVREEAEKLVAVALAALSTATRGLGGSGFATGSAECCVCPVCRTIAAMRDPGSDLAERLTAGLGDRATGVTAVLRTLSGWGGRTAEPEPSAPSEGDEYWENLRRKATEAAKAYGRPSAARPAPSREDDPWRVATREPATDESAAPESPVAAASPAGSDASEPAVTRVPRPAKAAPTTAKKTAGPATGATKPVAKKAVAKKAGATQAGAATKAVAKKAVAKKATTPVAQREPAQTTAQTAAARVTGARKAVTKPIRPGGAA